MLKVWGRRTALNVQKVLWLIGELDLAYENVPAGGGFGRLDDPGFRALNPHGRIPVLEDSGLAVWESHAILRYLAARYGGEPFRDEDPGRRAQAEAWMDWSLTALQPAFLDGVFQAFYRTPERQRDWPAIRAAQVRCAELFGRLDTILSTRPFLTGEALSLADIPAGALLYRYFELELERPALPHVEGWYARLSERSAYRQHVMVPFEELRARD
jgi:glutathione S-transferase